MSLTEILNFKLIITDNYTLTVSSLLILVFILLVTVLILKFIKKLFNSFVTHGKLDAGSSNSIYLILRYIIWVVVIIISLDTLGFKVSILLASVAALLVGVGLGLQQLFNDISSGIVLLIEQSIKVDDIIELDNGNVGKVVSIGIRTSKIKTRDDIIAIIPNSKLVNDIIINWSHIEKSTRFFVQVGVAYGSDVKLVKELLLKSANHHPDISQYPAPFVRFVDFGNSSLDFQIFFWVVKAFAIESIKSDIRFEINQLFIEKHIQIPFPQTDVHIKDYLSIKPKQ